jgi:hypothetical protein
MALCPAAGSGTTIGEGTCSPEGFERFLTFYAFIQEQALGKPIDIPGTDDVNLDYI